MRYKIREIACVVGMIVASWTYRVYPVVATTAMTLSVIAMLFTFTLRELRNFRLWTGIIIMLWLSAQWLNVSPGIGVTPSDIAYIVPASVSWLPNSVYSGSPMPAIFVLFATVTLVGMMERGLSGRAILLIIWNGLILCIVSVVFVEYRNYQNVFAIFEYSNHFGSFAVVMLGATLALVKDEEFRLPIAASFVACVILSGCEAAIILMCVILSLHLSCFLYGLGIKIRSICFCLLLIGVVGVAIIWNPLCMAMSNRIWRYPIALNMIQDNWLTGVGTGGYKYLLALYMPREMFLAGRINEIGAGDIVCGPLQLLVNFGVVMSIFIGLHFLSFVKRFDMATWCVILVALVHSLIDTNMQSIALLMVLITVAVGRKQCVRS